jgi:hypothetical protein
LTRDEQENQKNRRLKMEKEKIKEILDLFESDDYVEARDLLKEEIKKDVYSFVSEKAKLKDSDDEDSDDEDSDDEDSDDEDSDDEDSDDEDYKKKKK